MTPETRAALRRLAAGVSVLTFRDGERAHGATVSSVSAVSREPLLLAACLGLTSRFADYVAVPGARFGVNVLSAGQAPLASWFADPRRPLGLQQFDCVDWLPDGFSGAPMIDGSLATMGCEVRTATRAGDHHLIVAEVITGAPGDGLPLLSFAGQLHDGPLRSLPDRQAHPYAVEEEPMGAAR